MFGLLVVDVCHVLSTDGTERHEKEVEELKTTAQAIVNLVEPVEDSSSSLVERLQKVPEKIVGYLAKSSRNCVAQTLGLEKSYWPSTKIALVGDGMCAKCDYDQFIKYVEESEPVADQIVNMIEQ